MAEKFSAMQEGGKLLGEILQSLLKCVVVGANGLEIDQRAESLITKAGGVPSFKMVPNYRWSTCICTNDIVVHGLPTNAPFDNGDIVGIDVGMYYKGFHTDTAWTVEVGNSKDSVRIQDIKNFLHIGKKALQIGIEQVEIGKRIGHISKAIQDTIEREGYYIIRTLVGHGIGKKLHEEPEVPGMLTKDIDDTPELYAGMTLAIEVIYAQGTGEVCYDRDGWTIRTEDHSWAGLFEQTVALTHKGVVVLTHA